MEVFVKQNQSQASHVKYVVIDNDFSEIKAVKSNSESTEGIHPHW